MKISIPSLVFSTSLVACTMALANEASVPRLDKALLNTPKISASKASAIVRSLRSNCSSPAASKNPMLIDACELEEILAWFRQGEKSIKISLAEPLMNKVFAKEIPEEKIWRHYLRTFMLRRSISAASAFFSKSAGSQRNYIGMVSIPMAAGSLDQFSLWSRLITMSRTQICNDSRNEYCSVLRSQLITLARQSWQAAKGDEMLVQLEDHSAALRGIAADVSQRLEQMSLAELKNLEDMEDSTSAGLGIPFLRQVVVQLKAENEKLSDIDSEILRKMILLTDIKLAMDQFEEPSAAGNPDEKSVLALSQELQQLGQFAITTPQP